MIVASKRALVHVLNYFLLSLVIRKNVGAAKLHNVRLTLLRTSLLKQFTGCNDVHSFMQLATLFQAAYQLQAAKS